MLKNVIKLVLEYVLQSMVRNIRLVFSTGALNLYCMAPTDMRSELFIPFHSVQYRIWQ